MTAFKIEITDAPVLAAFNRLLAVGHNSDPTLKAIGEALVVMSRRSFDVSASPDGTLWEPNSPVTLGRVAAGLIGRGNRKRDGSLSAKGGRRLAAKKPLIGEGRFLSGPSLHRYVTGGELTVGSSAIYAAIQQFGGTKARFPHLWGDLPARPFLPVTLDGQLMEPARRTVADIFNEAIAAAWQGQEKG